MTRSGRITCAVAGLLALTLAGCQTSPITGRSQLILLSDGQANQLGVEAYKDILKQSKVSKNKEMNRRVRTVGERIAAVSDDPGFDWEFKVIEDDTPNAFALPGGKVGVHTGLFKVAKNDDQLAAVMAHEVAHALARHSAERMSRQILIQTGLGVAAATSEAVAQNAQIVAQMATLGLVLPFGRDQESEADEIGLTYMAQAGYDPREAITLWQNFEKLGGDRPPEFLSTHPSPGTRIQRLQALMPEALEIYRKSGGS